MSELIDRQALIKQLKDENIPFNADINEIINIQPIAFDVDNIVEKLEEAKEEYRDYDKNGKMVYELTASVTGLNKAINIVKQEMNNGLE